MNAPSPAISGVASTMMSRLMAPRNASTSVPLAAIADVSMRPVAAQFCTQSCWMNPSGPSVVTCWRMAVLAKMAMAGAVV